MHTGVAGAKRRARCKLSLNAAAVASSHKPKQPGVMRPRAVTAVASMMNKDAPLLSKFVQCVKCQSLAKPSCDEYWHIGATTTRLDKVSGPRGEPSVNSEKSELKITPSG
jgi:hypothetical protein